MPTGGSGSPFFAGMGCGDRENHPSGGPGGRWLWDQALWSSSHSFSAVGCQQAA